MKYTFKELAAMKSGTIVAEKTDGELRIMIMRGPLSLCAYIGFPATHPLAGTDYNDVGLSVHGGITFGDYSDHFRKPDGYFWYGWDDGHCDDRAFYDLERGWDSGNREWLVEDVMAEAEAALPQMRQILDDYHKGG